MLENDVEYVLEEHVFRSNILISIQIGDFIGAPLNHDFPFILISLLRRIKLSLPGFIDI